MDSKLADMALSVQRIFDGEYFEIIKCEDSVLHVRCVMCGPDGVSLRSSPKSNGNILKHIKRRHPEALDRIRETKNIKCRAHSITIEKGQQQRSKLAKARASKSIAASSSSARPAPAARAPRPVVPTKITAASSLRHPHARRSSTVTTTDMEVMYLVENNGNNISGEHNTTAASSSGEALLTMESAKYAAHITLHLHPSDGAAEQTKHSNAAPTIISSSVEQQYDNVQYLPAIDQHAASPTTNAIATNDTVTVVSIGEDRSVDRRSHLISSASVADGENGDEMRMDGGEEADDEEDVEDIEEEHETEDDEVDMDVMLAYDEDEEAEELVHHDGDRKVATAIDDGVNRPSVDGQSVGRMDTAVSPLVAGRYDVVDGAVQRELLELRKQLMLREFELVKQQHAAELDQRQQRHALRMDMLRNEMECKRRQHEAAMRVLNKRLRET